MVIDTSIPGRVDRTSPAKASHAINPNRTRLNGVFSIGHGSKEPEEVIYARDLQGIVYAIADANQIKTASLFLMRHIGAHQRADAG